jgi:uncharacterized protein with ParB-like and HNH nuclease domain
MEASPTKVIQYFDGQKQNLIPLFQRRYTWELDNWKSLWDDLMVQYELGESGTHFMGAIVSVPALAVPVGVSKFLIIDGQQRLTTVSLILCALRDCLDDPSAALIQGVYLTNPFRELEDTLKFVPTQGDREVYREIALDRQIPSKDSLMGKAYHFFKDRILNSLDSNDEPVLPAKVLTTLQQCLQVVMINLSNDDDPYLIFESLNFKGEPLTQADLVRNYVLMRFHHSIGSGGEQQRIYRDYWKKIEEALDANLTEFLRHYTMKDGEDIKQGGIYAAIKKKLKSMDTPEAVEAEVSSIQRFSDFYATILCLKQEPNKAVQDRLNNIQSLKVTTSYPLLLRFFDDRQNNKLSDIDLEKCLGLIESYIVRRTVCGVPTNTLNKLFIQWARSFPSASYVQWLHDVMSSGSGGRRFPRDAEFTEAFLKQPQYGRGTTRFILCRLEKSFNNKEMIDLAKKEITIEHILPQKLSPAWEKELGTEPEEVHTALVHTFGNLTLTAYNPELGNLPFKDKKNELEKTHIDLNKWILNQRNWGAVEIGKRAKFLLSRALKIWSTSLS